MELFREIRDIDSDKIVIQVPKILRRRKRLEILVLPVESREDEEASVEKPENENRPVSGLCGIWKDERSSEEIIDDIYSHRTGFGNRRVTF